MILYYDNIITNNPLTEGENTELDEIRNGSKTYHTENRLKVALYTLISYSEIKWSNVIIRYELDDPSKRKSFETIVLRFFPKAIFIYGRSDNQKKFQEIAKLINYMDDEWIFYAGNNDHPFIAPDKKCLSECLKKAIELKKAQRYVSIFYSHFTESLNIAREGTPGHEIIYNDSKILEEDENLIVALFPKGVFTSIQIVHKDLLNHWVFSQDWGDKTVTKIEYADEFIDVEDQVVVIPKKIICECFDGYSHTINSGFITPLDIIPPLFIPDGFFNKDIKIAYGYDDYREGYVNINPLKENYSFRDNVNGTDLMITLDEIPMLWRRRIKTIDINPDLDIELLKKAREIKFQMYKYPYPERNEFGLKILRTKLKIRKGFVNMTPKPVYSILRKSKLLERFNKRFIKY